MLPCFKKDLDTYCDFIARKERAFRELVAEPADHYIDLFWARLLPYVAVVRPGQTVDVSAAAAEQPGAAGDVRGPAAAAAGLADVAGVSAAEAGGRDARRAAADRGRAEDRQTACGG